MTSSSRRQYSLRQDSDNKVHTSLLDNWHYQAPVKTNPHSKDEALLPLSTFTGFNINEDDLDCPGHDTRHHPTSRKPARQLGETERMASSCSLEDLYNVCLATSSSSEGIYDSGDDDVDRKIRAMSVDEVQRSHSDDDSNNNVLFMLPHPDEDSGLWDSDIGTPTVQTPPVSGGRRERRASVDNGVLGVADKGKGLEGMGAVGWHRNALTEPGTPAEPCTPLASTCVSLEELLADSKYLISKLQPLLCAERVNQMTRTCNDIETVTSLLEEKERDLELAARIGQTLLSKNQDLSSRKEALEEQLSLANDTINQLKHELSKKVQELEVYDQDLQNQNQQDDSNGVGAADPSPGNAAVEKLQRKVGTLEEENLNLRLETAQLRSDTESYEVKEKKLVKESLQQFVELTQKVDTLTEELKGKKKENSQQREEISSLIAQLNDICQRVRQLTEENADLLDKLQAAQESQTQLARELSIQKDRYDELFETLERTQEQLRYQSQGSQVRAGHQSWPSSPDAISMDSLSLASELQQSLNQKLSQDEDRPDNRSFNWRVFETARAAHRAASKSRSNSMRLSSSASSCWDADSLPASVLNSDTESMTSDGYGGDMDSVCGSTREMGRPGVPGSNDLQTALQRLAGKQGYDSDDAHRARGEVSTFRTPGTPDSLSSGASGYSYLGCSRNPQHSSSQYKMSSKLQIVKPMEGSVTLQQWQRLAQPHLGGLFERREGVKVKGERKLDLDGEAYTLSDFEDEDGQEYQSSLTESSGCLPLLSSANHHNVPSLHSLASLPSPSQRASTVSPQPMASSTPSSRRPSRQSGDSRKYTMSLGLAAVLQDRDTSLARAIIKTNATCPKVAAGPLNNSSSVPVIPAEAVATASAGSLVNPMSRASQGQHPSSDSHHGLFGKLISSGYNLLWNKSDAPVPPATESAHSQETVPEEGAQAAAQNPAASQMFPKGGSGVLGAIATLRKNGIL